MLIYDDTIGLESLMQSHLHFPMLVSLLTREAAHQLNSPATSSPVPEPMQLDMHTFLTHATSRQDSASTDQR